MAAEPGARTDNGVPLGETRTPRLIVDGHGVELREQKGRERATSAVALRGEEVNDPPCR